MSTEMVVRGHDDYMPVMSIAQAVERRNALIEFTKACLIKDHDYGVIPGTNGKDVLYKPGAEKLCTMFGLTPMFEVVNEIERWEPDANGELLFSYVYRCSLYRGERLLANAEGACNSREKKYRYRNADRKCPDCGAATIRKSKEEWGGGYYCNGKSGGCGAKFLKGDPSIENQETGNKPNPEIPDLVNTLRKMSQKRAFVSAVLTGVNASEFFTVDLEDNAPAHSAAPDTSDVVESEFVDPVKEAAEREAAERAEAERRAAAKVRADKEARDAFAAFTARADEYGFDKTDRPSLSTLAKTLLKKDRPGTADLNAALTLPRADWGLAIDDTNAALAKQEVDAAKDKPDPTAGMSEGEKAAQELLSAATPAEAKATIGAMSR